ncbi:hypothetical protein AOX63_10565 [Pseudomonas sp. ADP]|nr:hypothetical protein AOX63_10565 [Pseudomonas sp. ADP]
MNWASVELFLPGDRQLGRGGEALEIITQREFVDSEAIAILWQDYAVGDVIRYLLDQCYIYGLELYDEDIEKVQATVRFGLRSYSVSQLWFIMWKVVKDAASLASREYYNRLKAAATIPSKIRKQLEKADSEGGIRRGWDRPENHLAGSLGMVLLELFGINEYTKGSEVIEILSQLGGTSEGRCREDMRALVSSFMKVAIESEASVAFMEKFAEFIRSGLETRAALEEVMKDDC